MMADYRRRRLRWKFQRNRQAQLMLYFNLASFLQMSMPLAGALDQLWMNETDGGLNSNTPVAKALEAWRQSVRSKSDKLCDAMVGWVPERDRMVIRAGEKAGALADGLLAALVVDEASEEMQAALVMAVLTPAIVLSIMVGVIWTFGIQLFGPIKQVAPGMMTGNVAILSGMADYLAAAGIPTFIVLAGLVGAIVVTLPHLTGSLRQKLDGVPPWSWFKLWYSAAFLLSLSSLVKAEVTPKEAIEELLVGANPWLRERLLELWRLLSGGKTLGEALVEARHDFPERAMARNIKSLEQRPDFGAALDSVTKTWIKIKVKALKRQAKVIAGIGMFVAAVVVTFAGITLFGMTQQMMTLGSKGF